MSRTVDAENREAFAYVELAGGNLELLQLLDENGQPLAAPKPPVESPFCPHLALGVDDLDSFAELLQSKDIEIIKGPLEIPGMVKWLYIADPDNNIIEFVQWISGEYGEKP
jgi:hypothetical protein